MMFEVCGKDNGKEYVLKGLYCFPEGSALHGVQVHLVQCT